MMNVHLLSIASLTFPVCCGWAFTAQVPVSSDLTYASDYVFRGIETADESFQPTLEAVVGDFYAGLWANLPTGREGSEIHYYGGLGFDIPEVEFVYFDTGMTVRHYPDSDGDRTHEFYLGGNVWLPDAPALSGSLYYFYDVDIHSHVGEATVTYSQTLERLGLPAALDFSILAGVQGGGEVKTESYHFYGGSIELPFMLNNFSVVTAGVHYATAEKVTLAPDEDDDSFYWTISYTTSF